jgi:hypothetical protein
MWPPLNWPVTPEAIGGAQEHAFTEAFSIMATMELDYAHLARVNGNHRCLDAGFWLLAGVIWG